jgi:LuxR family maltose regulon positive regulatory protein
VSSPLLTTKLYIPRVRPELVSRPRLVERLNAGRHRKLTLISAPAGFGKTTLLSEWTRRRGRGSMPLHVAWVSLDEGDNDPARFLTYLTAALQTLDWGADGTSGVDREGEGSEASVGQGVLSALQARQPPSIEVLLTGLINEIAAVSHSHAHGYDEREGRPYTLVLDDYHLITAQPIHAALGFLLEHLPTVLRLVIVTRSDPPLPIARLRARGQLMELRSVDLRFTLDEAATFLNQVMGLELSAADIAALDRRTEGWIAGLQMAALSMQGRGDVTTFIEAFGGSHRFVLDYLVEEVLDRQSSDIQDFLRKTSILERMTASLCDAILEIGDWRLDIDSDAQQPVSNIRSSSQRILEQLEAANLFIVPLDDERRWYRYHHLFADLLRSRLEQTWPDQAPALHRRASEWYERAELVEEAVAHAFAGEDTERAARLIEKSALQVIVDGKVSTLSWWLEALPRELVRARPWLCIYHAWTRYWIGLREQGEECLQHVERALASTPLPSEGEERSEGQLMAGRAAAIRAYYALTNAEVPRALEMAQRALRFLPEGDYMHGMAALALGGAHWGQGDVVAAQQAFAEASTTAQRCGYRFLAVSAACYVGMQQVKQAQLHRASETFHEALRLATGPGGRRLQLPAAGFPSVKLGDLSREWNDLATADRHLAKGVELCTQWGQADVLSDAYVALARLRLAQGDPGSALETMQKAAQLAQRTKVDPWIACWLDDCRLRVWLSAGNLAAAVRWAEESGLRVDGELSFLHDLEHINLARVLVAQGTQRPSGGYLDEALGLLARLLKAAQSTGWINEEIKTLILQALALKARGDTERAIAALARAVALAEPGGYVRTFVDEGAPMHELLRQAATQGIASNYTGRLLAAMRAEEHRSQATRRPEGKPSPLLIQPLSERELEVLRLLTTTLSGPEIAEQLVISVNTVRSHIKNIYSKLDVHRRMEAVERARELGLL